MFNLLITVFFAFTPTKEALGSGGGFSISSRFASADACDAAARQHMDLIKQTMGNNVRTLGGCYWNGEAQPPVAALMPPPPPVSSITPMPLPEPPKEEVFIWHNRR